MQKSSSRSSDEELEHQSAETLRFQPTNGPIKMESSPYDYQTVKTEVSMSYKEDSTMSKSKDESIYRGSTELSKTIKEFDLILSTQTEESERMKLLNNHFAHFIKIISGLDMDNRRLKEEITFIRTKEENSSALFENKLKRKEDEIKALTFENSQMNQQISELKGRLEILTAEKTQALKRIEELIQEGNHSSPQIIYLQQEIEELNEKIKSLKETNEKEVEYWKKTTPCGDVVDGHMIDIEALLKKIRMEISASAETSSYEINALYKSKVEELERTVGMMEIELHDANKKNHDYLLLLKKNKSEITFLNAKIEALQFQIKETEKMWRGERSSFEKSIKTLKEKMYHMEKEIMLKFRNYTDSKNTSLNVEITAYEGLLETGYRLKGYLDPKFSESADDFKGAYIYGKQSDQPFLIRGSDYGSEYLRSLLNIDERIAIHTLECSRDLGSYNQESEENKEAEPKNQEADFRNQEVEFVNQEAESGSQEAESGNQEAESGNQEAESGNQEAESGNQEAESGSQEAESGSKEAESGNQEAESGSQEAESGSKEAESGNQEAESGNQEAESGNQEAESGNQEAESGNQEAESGNQEAESDNSSEEDELY